MNKKIAIQPIYTLGCLHPRVKETIEYPRFDPNYKEPKYWTFWNRLMFLIFGE